MNMQSALRENTADTPPAINERSHRITIVLSEKAAKNLDQLKTDNESASFGELVRRSMQLLHRVYFRIGMPKSINAPETAPMTHRVQAIISHQTVMRIEELCKLEAKFISSQKEEEDVSKSEIVRTALELYAAVSEAQREMRDFIIEGRTGKISSSLALAP
jgi:hypothetical protein